VYNLALLDLLPNGEKSDITETRNKDIRIVLATIIHIINDFFDKNHLAIVLFKGSDERRQRLYRIVISQEFPKLSQQFRIFGSIGEIIEPFEANRSYDFFLVTKL
jgi:hypothetical protein